MANQLELYEIVRQINKDDMNEKVRVREDVDKYLVYHGQLRDKIKNVIASEFQDPDTISELMNRVVPINITKKITDKLAKVYNNGAMRQPVTPDDNDQELIDKYSESTSINMYMDYCNKMTKLTKHSLLEPYLDSEGIPRLRVLPSHSFSLWSNDPINPEKETAVIKYIDVTSPDKKEQVFAYWDDESHWIIDGQGNINKAAMEQLVNPEGINPYGAIPFVHVTQQHDLLYPIRSSDIMSVQIAVCLLLSDTALAQKYLSWATLVITGSDGEEKVKVGPAATLSLPRTADGEAPDAKYLQPELNSDEVLNIVEKLVEYVLTTNNLSAGTVIGKLRTSTAASGVSKMFDNLESTEEINEQRKIYSDAERDLWGLVAHYMLPVWVDSGKINTEYAGAFSNDFKLSIRYPDIKPMLTKKERIESAKMELDAGVTSLYRAIKDINPDMEDSEVEDLINEIQKEKLASVDFFQRNMNGAEESEG